MSRLILPVIVVVGLSGLLVTAKAGRPTAAEKLITNSIGMKLALIPAGKFRMGSSAAEQERDDDELQHEVAITKPFYMGIHEVTQQQHLKVMADVKKNDNWNKPAYFNETKGGGPDHPVENVPWKGAVEFCRKLSELPDEKRAGRSYRLPTEAEWEYACRAGTTTVFHFGDTLTSKQANFNGAYPYGAAAKGPHLGKTAKVGSYPPNAFGLYDMHGNVGEWCADWYDPSYYKTSPREDPPGPAQGVVATGYPKEFYLVVRGGSWFDEARGCRSAYRFRGAPDYPNRSRLIGFRVVCLLSATQPQSQ